MSEQNEPLSERELEILRLVATGAANKEIARQLVISPNTVKVHLRNIFAKIGVSSRTEATLYAVQLGLVNPGGGTLAAEGNDLGALTGLPGITIEDETSSRSAGSAAPARSRPFWQIGLLFLLALALIGSGAVVGARLLATPTPFPTVAASATASALEGKRWSVKPALPAPRQGMGVVAYENAFYLAAGETADGLDGKMLRYDPKGNAWETLASKPTPVTDVQAALLGEKIYVPGGRLADGSETDQLEVYDLRQDSWERKSALPVAVSSYALASFEGQLYLFGGKHGSQYLNSVYIYNPQEDRWTEGSGMDVPRAYASAVEVSGKIQLLGGYDGQHALDLNQAYIPARDGSGDSPWESLAPLPQGRYAMGATYLASIVYLLGGIDDNGQPVKNGALQYLVQQDQWTTFDNPPKAIGEQPAVLSSGNFVYVIGGKTANGLSAAIQSYQAIYTIAVPILRNEEP